MADEEEEKEYRWETGYEKTWYICFYEIWRDKVNHIKILYDTIL